LMTTRDLVQIRDIDALCVSPTGEEFAVLVRQADVALNDYRLAWFIGEAARPGLRFVADGGRARLLHGQLGFAPAGDIGGGACHWSPDGKKVAYLKEDNLGVQVWAVGVHGAPAQLTNDRADVHDFDWTLDGRSIYYTVSQARDSIREITESGTRDGFRVDQFIGFHDIIFPGVPSPVPAKEAISVLNIRAHATHSASAEEANEFQALRNRSATIVGVEQLAQYALPHNKRGDGALAYLMPVDPNDIGPIPDAKLMATFGGRSSVTCMAEACKGQNFFDVWWSGSEVIFHRWEGISNREDGIYAWNPRSGHIRDVYRSQDGRLSECSFVAHRLVCLRQLPTIPTHVFSIDVETGHQDILADVNPEFAHYRLGRVERIEWDLPPSPQGFEYPKRARAYVIYPPDFNAAQRYPVFIAPYTTGGFLRGDAGDEHPLFVYAANGMIVINSEFPSADGNLAHKSYPTLTDELSPQLGFPHLNMLMQSTFRALDVLVKRGVADVKRVGIGGVSQGAFMPLWMMMQEDRLAAVSVGGPAWSESEPYIATRRGLEALKDIGADPELPESHEFWLALDPANHVAEFEAPILMQMAAKESVFGPPQLIRRLEDARLPYDAYIFQGEYHFKVQPAHRAAIYERNLDWFKFWLEDYEDPSSLKSGQYTRWRKLRELQCRNPRSVRNYCDTLGVL
jgi:hypothetical protein